MSGVFVCMRRMVQSLCMKKVFALVFVFFFLLAPFSPARAQVTPGEFKQPCVASYATDVPTIQGLECVVANILATAITLVGIVAFVMFLIGGFQYLTAGANAKGVEQGKNSISFAILGLVVALASIMILNIISTLTGVKGILQFSTQLQPQSSSQQ